MESDNIDPIIQQAKHVGQIFAVVYKDVTGEEFDLESAIRHYPLLALGIGAGAGAIAGYLWGRRRRPQLPAPPAEPPPPPRSIGSRLGQLEQAFPEVVEKVKEALPEVVVSDVVKARARIWMNNVVDTEIRENVDAFAESVDARIANFFRGAMERLDTEEDVHLEEPEAPE